MKLRSLAGLICILVISVLATGYGIVAAFSFNDTAGPAGLAPHRWPERTSLRRSPSGPTLLVFAHPFCSCTQATFDELTKALGRRRSNAPVPAISILFFRPRGASWTAKNMWLHATQVPGASVSWDEAGVEAQRFGAGTSGAILLYAVGGTLLFDGGVTGSRGHRGDNYGADKLAAALNLEAQTNEERSQVFGCPLFSGAPESSRETIP